MVGKKKDSQDRNATRFFTFRVRNMKLPKDKDVEIINYFRLKTHFFLNLFNNEVRDACFNYIDTTMVLKRGLCDLF